MCNVCRDNTCYYGEYCGIYYHLPDRVDSFINPPVYCESENSMSKKSIEVEVADKADDNGIITKQSEVYVWNDQVFASYKSALAASKRSIIIESLCRGYYSRAGGGYTKAQIDGYVKSWIKNPQNYTVYLNDVLDVFVDILAE